MEDYKHLVDGVSLSKDDIGELEMWNWAVEELSETNSYFSADNEDRVYIYPNPFHDVLSVSFDNSETDNEVFIYDFMGILKHHETDIGSSVSIRINAPKGMYFVLIKTKYQSQIHKLIKL